MGMHHPRSAAAPWLGSVAILFLAAFLLYPLAVILDRGGWGVGIAAVVSDPFLRGRALFSTGQALLSTLITVALSLPAALLFARFDFPGKRLWRSAFTVPFVLPTIVAGSGFLALIGPRGLFDLDLRDTLLVILLAHLFYNFALVVRILGSHLEAVAPRLSEAAALLGAEPRRILLRVTLPLAAPALLAAAALVFILTFTSFGVILILAPAPHLATLEVEIYRQTAQLLNLDSAAALALFQLAVVGLVGWLYTVVQARLAVPLTARPARLPRPSGGAGWWLAAALAVALVLVLSPLLALTVQTFRPPGADGPSLVGFQTLFEGQRTIGFAGPWLGLINSLRFATLGAGLALFVGFAFAYAVVRARWRWLDSLSLLPLGTSAVTLGFGYLLAFPVLATSFWGIPVAHALIGFPFVARSVLPALRALPPNLIHAARTLGSNPIALLRRVELPLLTPSLVTAASFAFAVSLGEFGASLVLTRPEFATLPVAIFDRLSRPGATSYAAGLALALVLMVLTGIVLMMLERFGRSEI